jgi:hypothetical protein
MDPIKDFLEDEPDFQRRFKNRLQKFFRVEKIFRLCPGPGRPGGPPVGF